MSESIRGEGGRIWVYGDSSKTITTPEGKEIPCGVTGKPWYFLEELYPAIGNLVPRDIGAREVLRVCEMGLGVEGKNQVYLDVELDTLGYFLVPNTITNDTIFTFNKKQILFS
jgi:succinate dehydrogenase / fumarate reductase flavoprotein subunit